MLTTGVSLVIPGRRALMQTIQSGTPMQLVAMDILGPLPVNTHMCTGGSMFGIR